MSAAFSCFGPARRTVGLTLLVASVVAVASACYKPPYDFSGSGKSEIVWFNEVTHQWEALDPDGPVYITVLATGPEGSMGFAGDYDGDGRFDPAIAHAGVLDTHSSAGTIPLVPPPDTGAGRVHEVFGAYDGGRKTLPAFYRDADAMWFVAGHEPVQFGMPAHDGGLPDWDVPVPGDYDGNGTTDIATYSPVTGEWKVLGRGVIATFGGPGNFPLQADWDGDRKTDPAFIAQGLDVHISGKPTLVAPAGLAPYNWNWLPMPGDYDGDGRMDQGAWSHEVHAWQISVRKPGSPGELISRPLVTIPGTRPAPLMSVNPLLVNLARLTALDDCLENPGSCP